MSLPRALLASAAILGVGAAPAAALLPTFASDTIVPGKSIGGLKVLSKAGAAIELWGGASRGRCSKGGCKFSAAGKGQARYDVVDGKVLAIYLQLPYPKTGPEYRGPLLKLETSDGIGLGSSVAELKAAYPKAKQRQGIFTIGKKVKTNFATDGKRVFSIVVSAY